MQDEHTEKRGNVTLIKGEGKKKKVSADTEEKIKPADVYRMIADAIDRKDDSCLPPFPVPLIVYSASPSMRVIGELGPGDVVTIHDNDVAAEAAIMAYCNKELVALPEFHLTAKAVRDAKDFWVMATTPLRDVKAFRGLSDPGFTFNRLPWDLNDTDGPIPTWEGLLSRMTNASAFCVWIGSLFVENSNTHQYSWVYGQGGDGKGAINRFMAGVFAGAYAAKDPPTASDRRFWTFGLIGKRLVAFADCNDTKFVASGLFKSLTGGDPVPVEAKGKMPFTFKPTAKYYFFSNEKPSISSEKADTRRIIYCELEPLSTSEDPDFENRLWAEGGAFLSRCIRLYLVNHPTPGPIVCEQPQLVDWLSVVEERFEVIYEKHFCRPAPPNDTTSGLNRLSWDAICQMAVIPSRMQEVLRYYFKNSNQAGEFIKWLEIKHGVKKKTLTLPDDREPKVYVGLAEKALMNGVPDDRF